MTTTTKKYYYDKNWLTFEGVSELFDCLENKMVTNIEYSALENRNELGITKTNLCFKITTLHMGLGDLVNFYSVGTLHKENADALIDKVVNWYE